MAYSSMKIFHVGAELAPIAKVGGLADVLYGLSQAFKNQQHDIEIILPKYDCLDLRAVQNLEVETHDFASFFEGKWNHNTIWRGDLNGVHLTLIEAHDPAGFFERQTIYGCPDDPSRFLYFCRAVFDYLHKTVLSPSILHLHDWHTAALTFLLKTLPKAENLKHVNTLLTIHNIAYQGWCSKQDVEKTGVKKDLHLSLEHLFPNDETQSCNLLKAGLYYADAVTTVSPTYAKEVLHPEGGMGLEGTLNEIQHKFSGILNGIDYYYWDPNTDIHLPHHYSKKDWVHALSSSPFLEGKQKLQTHLRHVLGLSHKKCPLVSCITRLVEQKGPHLIKHAILKTLEKGGQFILLGAASDPHTHDEFYNLKRELAKSHQVYIDLTYNEALSHLIYASSDLFLVPSIFEPCGLTQMIAMRYGTVPLVRQTGGLADTVFEGMNGFCFGPPTPEAISSALDRAFHTWHHEPEKWKQLMHKGMEQDFSWKGSAQEYLDLYKKVSQKSYVS